MTDTPLYPTWPEPPVAAATEAEGILGALERQRATFWWKVSGLDDDQLRTPHPPSELTLARLLKHLAQVEDKLASAAGALPASEPWASHGDHATGATWGWTWQTAHDDTAADLYALWERSVVRAREVVADELTRGDLSQPSALGPWPDGSYASLRRLVLDILEEYGRHVGHADLIREAIDGRVGEDPESWPPDA